MPQTTNMPNETLPKKIIPFMWFFFRKHKWKLFGVLICVMLILVFGLIGEKILFREIIAAIESFEGDKKFLLKSIGGLLIIMIIAQAISEIASVVRVELDRKMMPELRKDMSLQLLDHTHNHSYTYFTEKMSGSIARKINDVQSTLLDYFYGVLTWDMIPSMLFLLVNVGIFMWIHPLVGFALIAWTVIQLFIISFSIKKWNKYQKASAEADATVSGKITDSLINFLNVKFFARQKSEKKYVDRYAKDAVKKDQRIWKLIVNKLVQMESSYLLFYAAIIFLPFYMYQQDMIALSDVVYIFVTMTSIVQSIWRLTFTIPGFVRKIGTVRQALDTLMEKHDIVDSPNAKKIDVKKGKIEFKNVWFKYKKDWVIKGLNLSVQPGEKVGVVGHSGAGKTTLVNLILRYFELNKGTIEVDDQGIKDVTQESLRAAITVVSQESILFHRSLLENIRYGNPKASKAMVEKAAKQAHAHDFIKSTSKGYQTEVGERGIKLSGGQRQRVCIARAILKDAPILLLDEATSALDSETEKSIQDSFDNLMKGRTTLVVAHRLSTLRKMDRIIVMDKGKIVEEGSHAALLRKKGRYAKLWSMQVDGFIQEN